MITAPENLQSVFDRTFAGISQVREAFTPQLTPREVGTIISVATGIAKVSGLPSVGFEELVKFPGDVLGIAFNVDEDEIGVVLLGEYWHLHAGDEVERTGRVMDVAVGDALLGRVIDPLGRPMASRRWSSATGTSTGAVDIWSFTPPPPPGSAGRVPTAQVPLASSR